jgi:hypothetical protein
MRGCANLAQDNRVSLTINHDTPQVMDITGLSMAARAEVVADRAEGEKALRLLMQMYLPQESLPLPMPSPARSASFGSRLKCGRPLSRGAHSDVGK